MRSQSEAEFMERQLPQGDADSACSQVAATMVASRNRTVPEEALARRLCKLVRERNQDQSAPGAIDEITASNSKRRLRSVPGFTSCAYSSRAKASTLAGVTRTAAGSVRSSPRLIRKVSQRP